jgi:serine/threonine protein kinase
MTDYQFYGQLGAGGFGVVYEVERTLDGLALAGKALRRGASQRDRRRFEREVRLQAKLDHPNIVPIVAMNLDDDPPWFVMPVAQENLRTLLVSVPVKIVSGSSSTLPRDSPTHMRMASSTAM